MKIMIFAASSSGCAQSPSQNTRSRHQDTVMTKASKTYTNEWVEFNMYVMV